jgi:serine/threonine-protein kinase
MAPEQLRSPRDVDARVDVWALGAILFELLTGRPPIDGASFDELRRAITGTPVPPIPGIPPELEWAVHRCLAKDPTQRFESVSALVTALVPFGSEESAHIAERVRRLPRGPRRVSEPPAAQPAPPTLAATLTEDGVVGAAPRKPARAAFVFFGVGLAVVAVGGGVLVRSRARERPVAAEAAVAVPSNNAIAVDAQPATPSAEPPSPTPSVEPSAAPTVSAAPRVARPVPREAPAPASSPSAALQAASAQLPDPLRMDGGTMFDGRK